MLVTPHTPHMIQPPPLYVSSSSLRPSLHTNPHTPRLRCTCHHPINHLTGFSEHFVSYILCVGNEKIRIFNGSLAPIAGKSSRRVIGTVWHNKGLYFLDNDGSSSSLSKFLPGRSSKP
ncbi:Beta-galactosidase [Cucumis melo var. makuwa]|uniref:Beta-galactosidase n=1 Tax=Cucumis melo var. makuwa TaxID=1194695 RepID=A0A5A7VED8_CUCMM|nr:Beta-galactosidase [Cucumis melo var. makuwa]